MHKGRENNTVQMKVLSNEGSTLVKEEETGHTCSFSGSLGFLMGGCIPFLEKSEKLHLLGIRWMLAPVQNVGLGSGDSSRRSL